MPGNAKPMEGGDAFLVADVYALDAEMLPCIIHDDDSYIEVHTTHCICSSVVLVLAMARATFKYYISACVAAMARATHIKKVSKSTFGW